jgi:hypothetical protein
MLFLKDIRMINIYMLFLLILIPSGIIIHECGHIIHFILNGLKIRCVVIGNIVLFKRDKWSGCYKSGLKEFFVIPEISDKYNVYQLENILLYNLIAGPIATVCMLIFLVLIGITIGDVILDYWLVRLLYVANIIVNISIFASCFVDKKRSIGDINAFFRFYNSLDNLEMYIWSYSVLNKVCVVDSAKSRIIFDELDEIEREDLAFDYACLFLLGLIEKIDKNAYSFLLDENSYWESGGIRKYIINLFRREVKKDCRLANYDIDKNEHLDFIYDLLGVKDDIEERVGQI